MTLVLLFLLGICLGSFVNALVWRIHQQHKGSKKNKKELSILRGRSMCPSCGHELAAKDLLPIFSWLQLKGRCRYCKKPISVQYPLVELALGLIFTASYVFWPTVLSGGQWLLFSGWLLVSVGLLALFIYDLRWMLLPNRILYPTFAIAITSRLVFIVFYSNNIVSSLQQLLLSVAVASGFFWVLFEISRGKWIGFGDVRLGLITGTVLAKPSLSLLMIFVASLLGVFATLPSILRDKKKVVTKIPFGPFLIAATLIALLFGQQLIDWYKSLVLL